MGVIGSSRGWPASAAATALSSARRAADSRIRNAAGLMPSTRAASAGCSPGLADQQQGLAGPGPEPLQGRDHGLAGAGGVDALLQALDVARADQPAARDPGQGGRLTGLPAPGVDDQPGGDPQQPRPRLAPPRIIGASRGEDRDERRGHQVGRVGRVGHPPGREPDDPVHVPAVEDLERGRIGTQAAQQLLVGRLAICRFGVHTCTWSLGPQRKDPFYRGVPTSAASDAAGGRLRRGRRTGPGGRRRRRPAAARRGPWPAGRPRPRAPGPIRAIAARPALGRGEQLGPAVRRVGEVLGQAASGQDVRDALHALPGDAHLPRDAGHGQRLAQDRAEHLPPRRGQPGRAGQFLGEREELAVQLERRDRGRGQQVLLAACHAGSPAGTAISS